MTQKIRYKNFGQLSMADYEVYGAIPAHPFWAAVDAHINFSFADTLCASLYSPRGQYPFAPSLKLKIHLVQRYYNLSDREMEERLIGDIFIKRFLQLPISLPGIDHSTIAFDRSRMGADLFHACHHYILAQALEKKLWGDKDDRWLVDAFHTYANISIPTTYRLIQQGIVRILQQLKRKNPNLYNLLLSRLDVKTMLKRLSPAMEKEARLLKLSEMVILAYGLLYWFEDAQISPIFWKWDDQQEQLISLELQALLYRILVENVQSGSNKPVEPDASTEKPAKETTTTAPNSSFEQPSSSIECIEQPSPADVEGVNTEVTPSTSKTPLPYEEIPKEKKPQNRIVNAFDPDIRRGAKSATVKFAGDKVQVVESSKSKLILNAEPIPGNEGDGEQLVEIVRDVTTRHGVKPKESVADGAYGYGENRKKMEQIGVPLTSPVREPSNPKGLFTTDQFQYNVTEHAVTCPAGQTTTVHTPMEKQQGNSYRFGKTTCTDCPLREQCTTAANGRTVFISDHHETMEAAKAYNQSDEGKEAMKARYEIERTNNEMKNHHGLKDAKYRGRDKFRIEVKITTMVINLKVIVKACGEKTTGFLRQKNRKLFKAAVCP